MMRQVKKEWSRADQHRLRAANLAGGTRACFAAFPDRTEGAVFAAMRRYTMVETFGAPVKANRAEIRRRTDALTIDELIDRLPGLLTGGIHA